MTQRFCRAGGKQLTGLLDLIKVLPNDFVGVELGSFAGESTALFATKAKTLYAVDLWGESASGMSMSVGSNERASDIEHRFDQEVIKHPNIRKMKMSTVDSCKEFKDNSLDMGYIDAVHTYEAVREDIVNYLPKIKSGGIICGHDYNPEMFPGTIQAVTEIFGDRVQVFEDTSWLAYVDDEKISVLMPVFNREDMVAEALGSILNQTHSNLELIVFDDQSKDNTLKIVQDIAKEDKRVRVITNPTGRGVAFARTQLLLACNTRLACWMDSDDLCSKYRLEIQFTVARSGNTLVFSKATWFNTKKDTYRYVTKNGVHSTVPTEKFSLDDYPVKREYTDKFLCHKNCFPKKYNMSCANCTACIMFTVDKSVLVEFPKRGNNHNGEDCYWVERMFNKGAVPVVLDDILYFHREHPDRITNVTAKLVQTMKDNSYEDMLDKYHQITGNPIVYKKEIQTVKVPVVKSNKDSDLVLIKGPYPQMLVRVNGIDVAFKNYVSQVPYNIAKILLTKPGYTRVND